MLKKLRTFIMTLAAGSILFAPLAVPATVSAAEIQDNLCSGSNLDITGDSTACNAATEGGTLNSIISKALNIFSIIVGIIAVVMIIIGGLKYVTSGGDSGNITGAKNTILYAIVGLVVVALAQFIVRFVLGQTSTL